MKLEDHVERIRLKVEDAVKNTLDRCGITSDTWDKNKQIDSNIEIGNYKQLIESIQSGSDWLYCYNEIVDDYAFTLFNRLICMKVLEVHGLYPEMITQRQQHSGKSYAHYMWLETNPEYSNNTFEGLEKYLSWQFEQLAQECDLFAVSIPLHMVPTATFCKEIIDLINYVDEDPDIDDDIWEQGNVLSRIYEIYNNSKKAALKASEEKVEYDKVPVQSQIYTPEWVVRFLVDNSLGKMYLEMYPDSAIKENHKILGDFSEASREKKALDQIKIIDPCVGSGNFLLYCFDLLYEMYMDQINNYGADYSQRDVPELIIEHNLHGIDLDERAVQLTKVGLFIKAKTKRNSIRIKHYNIVSASFRLPEYSEIGTLFDVDYFSKQFSDLIQDVWGDLQQAYKFGSLLRIDEKFEQFKKILKDDIGDAQLSMFTYEKAAEFDLFEKSFYDRLGEAISKYAVDDKKRFLASSASNALTYLRIITSKYDIVTSNPPYTDNSAFSNTQLGAFIEQNYKKPYNCTSNLYACFIMKNLEFSDNDGYIAMIHPHTFMNIDTFKDVRKLLLSQCEISCLVDYGLDRVNLFGPGILLDAVWQVIQKKQPCSTAYYFNITENQQEKYKKASFEKCVDDVIAGISNKRVSIINPLDFKEINGMPFMFGISEGFREKFENKSIEENGIKVAVGISTAANEKFIRLWWELNDSYVNPVRGRWFRYSKGGPYCKWFGNNWAVLDWNNDGAELKASKRAGLRNKDFYFRKGITYTGSGSKGTTFRLHEEQSLFDVGGSCIFPTGSFGNLEYLIAFLNSRLSFYLIDCLNPTVNTQVGDLKRVPFVRPPKEKEKVISEYAKFCIEKKRHIDEKYILNGSPESPLNIQNNVSSAVNTIIAEEIKDYVQILIREYLIDGEINAIYDLSDSDTLRMEEKMGVCVASLPVYQKALEYYLQDVEDIEKVSIKLNELSCCDLSETTIDEIKTKIRTVLFSKNFEIEDFCRSYSLNPITVWYFVEHEHIIPLVKAKDLIHEWFFFALRDILNETQDGIIGISSTDISIVQRLEQYADSKGITSAQLLQMEEYLGKKIRDFMEKDFFVELMNYTNVFMYLPKTPFIWHLSSGENRGFEALVSIYKWNADSLYKLKSNYISKRREKLEFRRTQLGENNTAQILEEKELIDKQLEEIDLYSRKIDELIASGYDPHLDDGVGKNIAPLQDKKLLKADVLNANQFKKYFKADW